MEATQISLANGVHGVIVGLVAVLATLLWSVLDWVWLRPKRIERILNQQGIHGNPYKLFHGDMKEIRRLRTLALSKPMDKPYHDYFPRVRPFLHRTMERFGKNCLTWEGPVPVVSIADVNMAREVFSSYNEFHKSKANPITSEIVKGLPGDEGHKWAQHRKLLNPAFRMEKLKLMLPAFYESCSEMIKLWEQKVSDSGQEIDVWDYLPKLTADAISRAAFGSSFEEGRRIFELITEQIQVANEISTSVYFPGLRFLPTKSNTKFYGAEREIKTRIASIIEKRKGTREKKGGLLGLLMDSNSPNEGNRNEKFRATTKDIVEDCKAFYLAGQETTSTLLLWTMIMLSMYQEWQSKAREEVLGAFGKGKPDFEGLNHLKILNMILQEVLRLYPPVIVLGRSIVEDNTKLGDITLPRGVAINLEVLRIHHDTEVWGEDAKEFNPERFSQGISKASGGSMSLLAFGWGPRICLGSNFAMIEAKLTLSMILQRFSFELSPSYVHAPSPFGLLHPQFGAPIIFRRL